MAKGTTMNADLRGTGLLVGPNGGMMGGCIVNPLGTGMNGPMAAMGMNGVAMRGVSPGGGMGNSMSPMGMHHMSPMAINSMSPMNMNMMSPMGMNSVSPMGGFPMGTAGSGVPARKPTNIMDLFGPTPGPRQ